MAGSQINSNKIIMILGFIVLLSGMLLSWWGTNLIQAQQWQQALATTAQKKAPARLPAVNKHRSNKSKSISFSHAALPAPPVKQGGIASQIVKKTPVQLTAVKQKPAAQQSESNAQQVVKGQTSTEQQNNQTQQLYHQLTSDAALSLEIAWPDRAGERDALFDYLYRCIGMQFAVLDQDSLVLAKKSLGQTPSDWLRVAQGELNRREIRWIQKYQLRGTPVRLLPKTVDLQLSRLISQHLGKQELSAFRGRYRYQQDVLFLDNIALNGRAVTQHWQLTHSTCEI